jgi:release factor glutamine methyltransferase
MNHTPKVPWACGFILSPDISVTDDFILSAMEIIIQELLEQLYLLLQQHTETPLLDAQVLVAHHLGKPRTWVIAHPEYLLNNQQYQQILQSVNRLEAGEPLPYVLGHWEFYGLDFRLTSHVLIPRPETELLVETAIDWLQSHPHKRRAVDVGTGSGCIAIAVAYSIPDLYISMTDISPDALNLAMLNAERYGMIDRSDLFQSDLLEQIPKTRIFDLVCANLPYIPSQKLANLAVAKNEPRLALDGGPNGLMIIQRLLEQVKTRISPGGMMLVEIDPEHKPLMIELLQENYPSANVKFLPDLSGKIRCVEIQLPYLIYHICSREDWQKTEHQGFYQSASFSDEGFIHCSQSDQYIEVANRYFHGVLGLVVLSIDPEKLTSEIRWEKSADAYYPHVYGHINLDAVVSIDELLPGSDGSYQKSKPTV